MRNSKLRKFHIYLNIVFLLSLPIILLYNLAPNEILLGILFVPAVTVIVISIIFGIVATIYHIIKSSNRIFIFASIVNASWIFLLMLAAFLPQKIVLVILASAILSHIVITYRMIKGKDLPGKKKLVSLNKRGVFLTLLLIFGILGDSYAIFLLMFETAYFNLELNVSILLAIISLFDLVFLVAIFLWERWGVYGFIVLRMVSIIMSSILIISSEVKLPFIVNFFSVLLMSSITLKLIFDKRKYFKGDFPNKKFFGFFLLFLFILPVTSYAFQVNFEQSAVGRIIGDSPEELLVSRACLMGNFIGGEEEEK